MSSDTVDQAPEQKPEMERENAFSEKAKQSMLDLFNQAQEAQAAKNALMKELTGRQYTIAEATAMGLQNHPEFKPKTAPYVRTQHEFEIVDEIKDSENRIVRVVYGKCIHSGQTFEECMSRPQDIDDGPTLCSRAQASKKSKWQNFGARRTQRSD